MERLSADQDGVDRPILPENGYDSDNQPSSRPDQHEPLSTPDSSMDTDTVAGASSWLSLLNPFSSSSATTDPSNPQSDPSSSSSSTPSQSTVKPGAKATLIDNIAISHEFTDHCHRETLLQCSPCSRVIAPSTAASRIRGWGYFQEVDDTPVFNGDYRVGVAGKGKGRGAQQGDVSFTYLRGDWDALYYHSAVIIAWNRRPFEPSSDNDREGKGDIEGRDRTEEDAAECVIYTPHGIHLSSALKVSASTPPLRPLAFLHGLHDVKLDWSLQLNLGAKNGLAAQRVLRAKHWVGTHDEVKKGGGLVGWFLRRKEWTISAAMEELSMDVEKDEKKVDGEGHMEEGETEKEIADLAGTFLALKNGESVVLV